MKKIIQHSLIMSTLFSLLVMSVGLLTSTFTQVDAQTASTSGQPGAATPTPETHEPTPEERETVSALETSNAFNVINVTAEISQEYAAALSQSNDNKTQANVLIFNKAAELGVWTPEENVILSHVIPFIPDWVSGVHPPFTIPGLTDPFSGGLFEGAEQDVISPQAETASQSIKDMLEPILSNPNSSIGGKAMASLITEATTPGQQSVPINVMGTDLVLKPEAMAEGAESIIGAAATGATIGAGFGPIGAAAGGVLGAAIGAFADWF